MEGSSTSDVNTVRGDNMFDSRVLNSLTSKTSLVLLESKKKTRKIRLIYQKLGIWFI